MGQWNLEWFLDSEVNNASPREPCTFGAEDVCNRERNEFNYGKNKQDVKQCQHKIKKENLLPLPLLLSPFC